MSYNVSFQVAALVLATLLSYYFLTQKKLYNANTKVFAYILIFSDIYIAFDLITTQMLMNTWIVQENTAMLILTVEYLFDALIPYILYCGIRITSEGKEKKIDTMSVICTTVTVAAILLLFSNIRSGWLFEIGQDGTLHTGTGYIFLYIYALAYIILVVISSIKCQNGYLIEKMGIVGEFLIIEGICMAVQIYTQRLLLVSFGLALGLLFFYLTMNNPGNYIDSTTGVFDKKYYDSWIQENLDQKTEFHLLAVKVYSLKEINKIYGSSMGDHILTQTAKQLQNITESVQVFRTTGNCFTIITNSLIEYEKTRELIERYFHTPFEIDGEQIDFPAIICGIINAEKMEQKDVLLGYIEYMLTLVKNTHETVSVQSDERILEGFRYEKEVEHFLKTAVEQDLFEIYYQPIYWNEEERYVTLEALSRLRHPEMGMIPPDVFIGIAEKQGMIAKIGLLQFERVCRFVKENESMMDQLWNVKFNLSPSELMKPGHSKRLIDIVHKYGLKPEYFQFEITETVATEYSESFCTAAEDFVKAGIRLCLDDFGSGYANLNTVLKLPFSVVKMDRSLLTGITCDIQAANFYCSIVTVMQNMGYTIVAEGAETAAEVKLLRKWGVDMIQGYYFSRPLPQKEILKVLKIN